MSIDSEILLNAVLFIAAAYMLKLYLSDLRKASQGEPAPNPLPGATPTSVGWVAVAVSGALLLVALETYGEIKLGIWGEQTRVAAWMLAPMLAAGVIEELVFRGYVYIGRRGPLILGLSALAGSILFTLGHYQYYTIESDSSLFGRSLHLDLKSGWTLFLVLLNSLWFYAVRFLPFNQTRSLLPCILAHMASNLAVYLIKLSSGFVEI